MMKSYETIIDNKKMLVVNELNGNNNISLKNNSIKHIYESLEEETEEYFKNYINENNYSVNYDEYEKIKMKLNKDSDKNSETNTDTYVEHHYVDDEEYYNSRTTFLERIENLIKWFLERSKTGILKIKKIVEKSYKRFSKNHNRGL